MHSLDSNLDVRHQVPRGSRVGGQITSLERFARPGGRRCPSPTSSRGSRACSVRRSPARFPTTLARERPLRRRGSGRRVRRRRRRCRRSRRRRTDDPLVGVDLDDVEHVGVERFGPLVAVEMRIRQSARSLAARRNDSWPDVSYPDFARARIRSRFRASRPCRIPAFTTRTTIISRRCRRPRAPTRRPSREPPSRPRSVRRLGLPCSPVVRSASAVRRIVRARCRGLPLRKSLRD